MYFYKTIGEVEIVGVLTPHYTYTNPLPVILKNRMRKIIIIIFLGIFSSSVFSQTFEKKYKTYIDTINILNNEVVCLRVPKKNVKSPAKDYIVSIQKTLTEIQKDIQAGEKINSTDKYNFKSNINSINYRDRSWKIEFYENEFNKYEKLIDLKSKQAFSNYLNSKNEEYEREKKELEDEIQKSLRFVNIGELTIYSDSSTKSEDIGHLPAFCAVKVVEELENGFSKIIACSYKSGFVKSEYLVTSKQLVTVESELKNIDHNFCYVIYPDDDEMYYRGYIPESERTYYLGPKGGCYYLTTNGHKVYVDRSVCN